MRACGTGFDRVLSRLPTMRRCVSGAI